LVLSDLYRLLKTLQIFGGEIDRRFRKLDIDEE